MLSKADRGKKSKEHIVAHELVRIRRVNPKTFSILRLFFLALFLVKKCPSDLSAWSLILIH